MNTHLKDMRHYAAGEEMLVIVHCTSRKICTTAHEKHALQHTKNMHYSIRKTCKRMQLAKSLLMTYVTYVNYVTFLDGYCSTVQALLDWFEVDLRD